MTPLLGVVRPFDGGKTQPGVVDDLGYTGNTVIVFDGVKVLSVEPLGRAVVHALVKKVLLDCLDCDGEYEGVIVILIEGIVADFVVSAGTVDLEVEVVVLCGPVVTVGEVVGCVNTGNVQFSVVILVVVVDVSSKMWRQEIFCQNIMMASTSVNKCDPTM